MTTDISWVEKYRPPSLNDVKGQIDAIKNLKEQIQTRQMPHLIFEGPAGTGKTSSALAVVNDTFAGLPKDVISESFLELNASDARGIGVVRTIMKDFFKTVKNPRVPYKILILDEADNMTFDAFQALRRTIEKYSNNCRLIMICNYANKIIPPIQSRCAVVHYDPLSIEEIKERLIYITEQENVNISEKAIETLSRHSRGDMRWAINNLQASALIFGDGDYQITAEDVYGLTGAIKEEEVRELLQFSIDGKLVQALDRVKKILNAGISGKELTLQMFYEVKFGDYDEMDKILITSLASDTIYRISSGCSELIQLRGFVAAIKSGQVDW